MAYMAQACVYTDGFGFGFGELGEYWIVTVKVFFASLIIQVNIYVLNILGTFVYLLIVHDFLTVI